MLMIQYWDNFWVEHNHVKKRVELIPSSKIGLNFPALFSYTRTNSKQKSCQLSPLNFPAAIFAVKFVDISDISHYFRARNSNTTWKLSTLLVVDSWNRIGCLAWLCFLEKTAMIKTEFSPINSYWIKEQGTVNFHPK